MNPRGTSFRGTGRSPRRHAPGPEDKVPPAGVPRPGFVCYGLALTRAGHEFFLASGRSDTVWSRIKTRLAERAVDLSFDAIVAAARALTG